MIRSPVTDSENVDLVRQIHRDDIIELYRRELNVNVARFFRTIEWIDVYECHDTGYRFYHPFGLAGDAALYQTLQQIPWYYAEGKQEHEYGLHAIESRTRVLEVGCGTGAFLRMLQKRECDVVGLELNAVAVHQATSHGVRALQETVEEHATTHRGDYDVVATFQVLEHIAEVKPFLDACVASLKPGGLLLLSVPNNDGAYHKHHQDPLNMPPHHMGLWTMNSLIALQSHFPMTLEKLFTDTSTPRPWVHAQAMAAARSRLRSRYASLAGIVARLGRQFITIGADAMIDFMPGQTVMAVFTKNRGPR